MPPQEEPPLEAGVSDDGLPMEEQESIPDSPDVAPDAPVETFDSAHEVMEVDLDKPVDPSEAVSGEDPAKNQPTEDLPPAEGQDIAEETVQGPGPCSC